jgi:hypothetical protein
MLMRINSQGRQVLRWNDALYDLEVVVALAKQARIEKVKVAELTIGDLAGELSPPHPNPTVEEVVYTKRGGALIVLLGNHKIHQAHTLERTEVPGRFISPFALKKAKI